MPLQRLVPANTFLNPDTNYGSNFAWSNPGNARDQNSATFAGVNSDGVTNPACRWQTPGFLFFPGQNQTALIGIELDWEFQFSGSLITNSGVDIYWQVTPGTTLETKRLIANATQSRVTQRIMLSPEKRQLYGTLTYLTAKNTGPASGTTTLLIYEMTFLYVDRGVASITSG